MKTHRKEKLFFSMICSLFAASTFAQSYVWTGKKNHTDLLTPTNWEDSQTHQSPSSSAIGVGIPVEAQLLIEDFSLRVGGAGYGKDLLLGANGSLSVKKSSLAFDGYSKNKIVGQGTNEVILADAYLGAGDLSGCQVSLQGSSTLAVFADAAALKLENTEIDLAGETAWIGFRNISLDKLREQGILDKIRIKGQPLSIGSNAETRRFYDGVLIQPLIDADNYPLVIYAENNYGGMSRKGRLYNVYSNQSNPVPIGDNKVASFTLRKGHMLTLADGADGTGYSRVFIAAERDMNVPVLDAGLNKKVSFMRVLPWTYVTKKGIGGNNPAIIEAAGATWFYSWSTSFETQPGWDFVMMTWGKSAASEGAVDNYLNKKEINHLLSFNEPDMKEQSNISPQQAADAYKPLLRSGFRLGSPSTAENGWKNWLPEFMKLCQEKQYRVDYIGIHWYDWGDWGSGKNPSPTNIDAMVNRFKRNITDCYNRYGLPIWITEFNANKNRITEVQEKFLAKAIPMLESLDCVERYAYFIPFPAADQEKSYGEFLDEDGNLTEVGRIYGGAEAYPSINADTHSSSGNLILEVSSVDQSEIADNRLQVVGKNVRVDTPISSVLSLIDVNGKVLRTKIVPASEPFLTDFSDVPSGLYLVSLNDIDGRAETVRIIL